MDPEELHQGQVDGQAEGPVPAVQPGEVGAAGVEAGLPAGRLGQLLELLAAGQLQQAAFLQEHQAGREEPARPRLKVPEFDGTGDVELFLQQFGEVAEVSDLEPKIQVLKLKEALSGKARDCAQPGTLAGVIEALRMRYGLTVRQARAGLDGLYQDARTSLSDHAREVDRLFRGAFPTLPAEDRDSLAIDKFVASVNNYALRNHLLARQPASLDAAVRAGMEFAQVNGRRPGEGARIAAATADENDEQVTAIGDGSARLESLLTDLTRLVGSLLARETPAAAIGRGRTRTSGRPAGNAGDTSGVPKICWHCSKEGHFRRDCPDRDQGLPGNANGP